MAASTVREAVESAFRDYVIDGVPSSGANEPAKSEIRYALGALLETALSSLGMGMLRYATIALRNADTTPADGQLAYVFENNGSVSDAANGYYQWNAGSPGAWGPATWLVNAIAAVVQSNINAASASVVGDVFLRYTGNRTDIGGVAGYYGTPLSDDPASPFSAGGSITSLSGLVFAQYRLDETPFRIGDTIVCRVYSGSVSASMTQVLAFYDSAGVFISQVTQATSAGTNDRALTAVVPANTFYIRPGLTGVGGTAIMYAVSFGFSPTLPNYAEGAGLFRSEVISSVLNGKTIALVGDSIPAGTDISVLPNASMATYLSRYLGAIVINLAVGGTTWGPRTAADYSAFSLAALFKAVKDAARGVALAWKPQDDAAFAPGTEPATKLPLWKALDWNTVSAVVAFSSTNDYGAEQLATATFSAAVKQALADLKAEYPHLQILVCTPIFRDRYAILATGVGMIAGTTLTFSSYTGAAAPAGTTIYVNGVKKRANIVSGTGPYTLDRDCGTVGGVSTAASVAGTVLTIGGTVTGTFIEGDQLSGSGLLGFTRIIEQLTGTPGGAGTYRVNPSQTVASTTIRAGYITLADPTTNGDDYANNKGATLPDYADLLTAASHESHCAVLDLNAELGLGKENATWLLGDGIHPSRYLARALAQAIARGATQLIRSLPGVR